MRIHEFKIPTKSIQYGNESLLPWKTKEIVNAVTQNLPFTTDIS